MIRAICAMDPTGLIGVNGAIPWRYPADFAHFKRSTMGGVCIMGRKTFESIPRTKSGEVLPGRSVVVLTRGSAPLEHPSNAHFFQSLDMALRAARSAAGIVGLGLNDNIWICGGAEIYEAALPYVEEIHVTWVPAVDVSASASSPTLWPIGVSEVDPTDYDVGHAKVRFIVDMADQPPGFAEAGLLLEVLSRMSRVQDEWEALLVGLEKQPAMWLEASPTRRAGLEVTMRSIENVRAGGKLYTIEEAKAYLRAKRGDRG